MVVIQFIRKRNQTKRIKNASHHGQNKIKKLERTEVVHRSHKSDERFNPISAQLCAPYDRY